MMAPRKIQTLSEDLLSRAADDWVSEAEVIDLVRESGMKDPVNLRDLSVGLIGRLIVEGLVVAGDVTRNGHFPWPLSSAEAILRIIREWSRYEDPFVLPGDVVWLDATPAGEAIGKIFWLPAGDGA